MSYRVMNLDRVNPTFQINRTADELIYDLNHEPDPVKRLMIKNFIRLRTLQDEMVKNISDEDSLESLSEEDKYDLDSEDSEAEKKTKKHSKSDKRIEELEELEKIKKSSMRELKKREIDRIREEAYREMVEGEDYDNDEDYDDYPDTDGEYEDSRHSKQNDHRRWRSEDLNDPKYARYAEEDKLNNRMMERLNTEIDFRQDDRSRSQIVKPFDDGFGMVDDYNYDDDLDNRPINRKRRRR